MAPPRSYVPHDPSPRPHFSSSSPLEVRLPRASVDGLLGLAGIVAGSGDRHDLSALARVLTFEINDVLPLIEAAELLGFVESLDGEVHLTEIGRQWVAKTAGHRELFAAAAYQRAPLVRAIVRALASTGDGTLAERFFVDLLRRGFTEDAARAQIDTAVGWGRYGELFDIDVTSRQLNIGRAGRDLSGAEKVAKSA